MQSISTIGLAPKLNDSDLFARILVQNQQGIGPEIVRMFEVQTHTPPPPNSESRDGTETPRPKCGQGGEGF